MTIRKDDLEETPSVIKKIRRKRPFWLKMLTLCWLGVASYGWIRFYSSIDQWQWLRYLNINPGPLYFAITGVIIGLIGLIVIYGLWFRKAWAYLFALITGFVLATWFWLDQLILTVSQTAKANWPFLLVATLLSLLYNGIVLYKLKNQFDPVYTRS